MRFIIIIIISSCIFSCKTTALNSLHSKKAGKVGVPSVTSHHIRNDKSHQQALRPLFFLPPTHSDKEGQEKMNHLLDIVQSSEFQVTTLGTFLVHELVFLLVNVPYLLIQDHNYFQKYKLYEVLFSTISPPFPLSELQSGQSHLRTAVEPA